MSYILDALKKAEAERRGGQHASGPIPPSFHVHAQRQPVWQRPWLWAVLSAAAVVAGGLIWIGGAPSSAPQPPAQETQAAQAPAAAATQPPPAVPVVPAVPAAPSAPVAQAPASPPPAAPAPSSAPPAASAPPLAQAPAKAPEQRVEKPRPAERKPAEKKAPEAARANKKPQQEEALAAAPAVPAPVPVEKPKPAPEPQVGTLRDLPPQIQQEVPQYSVGGYIYSGNKADRSVVINKRLLREGDEIAPGLTLERMTPTGMVLNYKGYRYRASY
ncbi:general secretion pathway protein GspB [Noviherbaspirillum aerium]|uniref:general secretion pathway protein GspB n=1 Tax=Noviherbaspirillum aerium TaxID=2588497 RepID=UPI00124DF909|nr:general secretion pathway protein GspB [Noviherbaspirillum aerium]